MAVPITINEDKVKNFIIQKIADYWNGRYITVTAPSGAHWSDFAMYWIEENVTDPETGETSKQCVQRRKRVPGTHVGVASAVGEISTQVINDKIHFTIDYTVALNKRADDTFVECNPADFE